MRFLHLSFNSDGFFAERPDYDERKVKVVYLAADAKFKPTSSPDIREKYGIKTKKYFWQFLN